MTTQVRSRSPQKSATRGLLVVAAANLIFGVPAVVPIWVGWYLLSQWPLAAMGVTSREPTENDGGLVIAIGCLPVIALGALLWTLLGLGLRSKLPQAGALHFWGVSAVAALLPTLGLFLAPLVR